MSLDAYLELQYVAARGLSSRAIEWFGGGVYSHVDIVWPGGWLYGARSDAFEIHGQYYDPGVRLRPPGYAAPSWRKIRRVRIPCTLEQRNRGLEWALRQAGKPYDWRAIVAFAIARDWREEGSWYCSELATRMLEVAFEFKLPLSPNKITPGTSACVAGALTRVEPLRVS